MNNPDIIRELQEGKWHQSASRRIEYVLELTIIKFYDEFKRVLTLLLSGEKWD